MFVGGFLQLAACWTAAATILINSCIQKVLNEANVTNCLHVFEANHEMLDSLGDKIPYSLLQIPEKLQASRYEFEHSYEGPVIWNYDSLFLSVKKLDLLGKYINVKGCSFPVRAGGQIVVAFYGGTHELAKLFQMLWWCRYVNVIVVIGSVKVFTYHPISQNNCSSTRFIALETCSALKEPEKFSGCTLYMAAYLNRPFINEGNFEENTGLLVSILRAIVKALGFNPVFWCHLCTDSSTTKIHEPDVNLLNLVLVFITALNNDVVYYPIQDELALYLPPEKPLQPLRNVFHIFDWTALLLSVVLLGLYLKGNFILVISILLGNTYSSTSRRLLLLWEFVALILTSAYSGLLMSFLCKSIITHEISTYEDLLDSKYKTCSNLYNRLSVGPIKDFEQCHYLDCQDCFDRLSDGTHAFLSDRYKLAYFTRLSGYQKWHKVWPKNAKRSFWYLLYNRKRSPFAQALQKYMMLMHESGLIEKLDVYKMSNKNYDMSSVNSVALSPLYFIFVVYGICIMLSCIVLVGELLLPPK